MVSLGLEPLENREIQQLKFTHLKNLPNNSSLYTNSFAYMFISCLLKYKNQQYYADLIGKRLDEFKKVVEKLGQFEQVSYIDYLERFLFQIRSAQTSEQTYELLNMIIPIFSSSEINNLINIMILTLCQPYRNPLDATTTVSLENTIITKFCKKFRLSIDVYSKQNLIKFSPGNAKLSIIVTIYTSGYFENDSLTPGNVSLLFHEKVVSAIESCGVYENHEDTLNPPFQIKATTQASMHPQDAICPGLPAIPSFATPCRENQRPQMSHFDHPVSLPSSKTPIPGQLFAPQAPPAQSPKNQPQMNLSASYPAGALPPNIHDRRQHLRSTNFGQWAPQVPQNYAQAQLHQSSNIAPRLSPRVSQLPPKQVEPCERDNSTQPAQYVSPIRADMQKPPHEPQPSYPTQPFEDHAWMMTAIQGLNSLIQEGASYLLGQPNRLDEALELLQPLHQEQQGTNLIDMGRYTRFVNAIKAQRTEQVEEKKESAYHSIEEPRESDGSAQNTFLTVNDSAPTQTRSIEHAPTYQATPRPVQSSLTVMPQDRVDAQQILRSDDQWNINLQCAECGMVRDVGEAFYDTSYCCACCCKYCIKEKFEDIQNMDEPPVCPYCGTPYSAWILQENGCIVGNEAHEQVSSNLQSESSLPQDQYVQTIYQMAQAGINPQYLQQMLQFQGIQSSSLRRTAPVVQSTPIQAPEPATVQIRQSQLASELQRPPQMPMIGIPRSSNNAQNYAQMHYYPNNASTGSCVQYQNTRFHTNNQSGNFTNLQNSHNNSGDIQNLSTKNHVQKHN